MFVAVTGKSGTIGKHFPKSTYNLKSDLTKDISAEIEYISGQKFSIIHSAGIVGEVAVQSNIKHAFNVNVNATKILADKALSSGVEKFIFISTAHVYKSGFLILDEKSEVEPINNYADQKRQAEIEIEKLFVNFPDKLIIARVFSILDWGMTDISLGGKIQKLISGKVGHIDCGDDVRDFLTPKSVASILYKLVKIKNAQGYINICTSNSLKISGAIEVMLNQCGESDLLNKINGGTSNYPFIVGCNKKLKKILPEHQYEWSPNLNYK
jgi:nucleoside-diphosphate-sugar epimerase